METELMQDKFHTTVLQREGTIASYPLADLCEPGMMRGFLEKYGSFIKALEPAAAGAYFASWLSYPSLACQMMMSLFGKKLDLSLNNMNLDLYVDGGRAVLSFRLNEWLTDNEPAEASQRAEWRHELLAAYYRDTVRPLITAVSDACGLHTSQLWGQLPTRFQYGIEAVKEQEWPESILGRVESDYHYLKQGLEGGVFGRGKNPLDVRFKWVPGLYNPDEQVRLKNACCYFYCTEGGYYCYTCPRISETERENRRLEYIQQQQLTEGAQ
ncbi:hypothetical protein DNH61_23630 [Paenibacillus sambharensis]|uniref:Ferric siderophore reductase C-terminal domain-containing protein n=1 Tax=Paenibacillus sambharensis TaxID=1803190 RepID=A0A2W1LEW3_9BACL|nr:hypothetical protein [Paenibacillus sambharensis]PZD93612.1 hypothetical protein DNH61_23630 [Paenibacillus sambharensis]